MTTTLFWRSVASLALAGLAASGLAAVPTHAAVTSAVVEVHATFWDPACTVSPVASPPPAATWTDNGVPVTQTFSTSGTIENSPTDIVDAAASSRVTVSATPINGGPATLTGSTAVSASVVPRQATTVCVSAAQGFGEIFGAFTLARPMWATLTVSGRGDGAGFIGLTPLAGDVVSLDLTQTTSGTVRSLLPADGVEVRVNATANASTTSAAHHTENYAVSYTIQLLPLGHASSLTGKGKKHVKLAARDCASGRIGASLTKKAKKAAKKVVVKVNGEKAVAFKGKAVKKRTFSLGVASAAPASVVANMRLRNGEKVTVTRTYLACS